MARALAPPRAAGRARAATRTRPRRTRGRSTRSRRSCSAPTSRTSSTSRESAFLAYRVVAGVAIVSGDPIGDPGRFDALVDAFLAHALERGWRVAILGVSERWLPLYERHGLRALYHGDEAIVDTATFSLEGRPIRKVRQSVHRLEREGYTARVLGRRPSTAACAPSSRRSRAPGAAPSRSAAS